MADDDPGTTLIVQGSVTYDVVQGPAPGTAAVMAARLEVLQNLDLGRILVDLEAIPGGFVYLAAILDAWPRKILGPRSAQP